MIAYMLLSKESYNLWYRARRRGRAKDAVEEASDMIEKKRHKSPEIPMRSGGVFQERSVMESVGGPANRSTARRDAAQVLGMLPPYSQKNQWNTSRML